MATSDPPTLRERAEQGNADAQFQLGLKYGRGESVERDFIQAARWCRQAADQGHVGAQRTLAVLCAKASAVRARHGLAVDWYRRAAFQ